MPPRAPQSREDTLLKRLYMMERPGFITRNGRYNVLPRNPDPEREAAGGPGKPPLTRNRWRLARRMPAC